jgi:hypothetical protein
MKSIIIALLTIFSSFAPELTFAQSCGGLNVSVAAFTPTGETALSATATSSSVALATNSGSSPAATKIVVTNISTTVAYVVLGDSTVTSSTTAGFPVLGGASVVLSIGSSTYVAAVTPFAGSSLVISTGY